MVLALVLFAVGLGIAFFGLLARWDVVSDFLEQRLKKYPRMEAWVNENVFDGEPLKLSPSKVYKTSARAAADDISTRRSAKNDKPKQNLLFIKGPFSAANWKLS